MRFKRWQAIAASTVVCGAVTFAAWAATAKYTFPLMTSTGQDAGTVKFSDTKKGVKMTISLKNMSFGPHGVHIHQMPVCEAPDFKSAGGHFNPDGKKHGFDNPDGHHAGDTPMNVSVGEDHTGEATLLMPALSLDPAAPNSIFANGGTSIVVHEHADDMKTDPSGNSGNRVACGVIKQQ